MKNKRKTALNLMESSFIRLINQRATKCLTEKEFTILQLCLGLDGEHPRSWSVVANQLGIPRRSVGEVKKRALEKISMADSGTMQMLNLLMGK